MTCMASASMSAPVAAYGPYGAFASRVYIVTHLAVTYAAAAVTARLVRWTLSITVKESI